MRLRARAAIAALAALVSAFGENKSAPAATLDFAVRPVFAGQPLRLDALAYANGAGETLAFSRLSCLLSGFALERENGGWVELPGQFAWMDAAQQRTGVQLADVPAGKYYAIRFHIGLDPETNAAPAAQFPAGHPLNPNVNGLHWSWQGGYVFLALEGRFRAAGAREPGGFVLHLARNANRARITLAAALDLSADAAIALDFDLAVLLNAPRSLSFSRDGAATHSRDGDPVSAVLAANLPGAFRVREITSATPALSQPSAVQPLWMPAKWTPHRFTMNSTFPMPGLPRDNPLIEERVALGRKLFHEPALSRDGTLSCASCHRESAAFSDPRRVSLGVRGQPGKRNAMPLFNLAWKSNFFWDGRAPSLRAQALVPLQEHTEMDETPACVVAKLVANPEYPPLFRAAFSAPEISAETLGLALENFLLTLTACNAKFDRAMRGAASFSDEEKRGFELFMTEFDPRTGQRGADCFHCHGGALFTDHGFHNNGLVPAARDADAGRFRVTHAEADREKFSTPSLRNIALTAPYMHDGRFATLEEVIDHYDHGVQPSATLDPNLAKHPPSGLGLSAGDKRALVAFLKTLTDSPPAPETADATAAAR